MKIAAAPSLEIRLHFFGAADDAEVVSLGVVWNTFA
jgi:hypothetical protein